MNYDTFFYNNKWLSDFNMLLYDAENEQAFVGKDIISLDINSVNSKANVFGTKYNDTLQINALICKDPDFYLTEEERKFTSYDIRNIRSWLMSPKTPMELIPYSIDYETDNIRYFGLFTDIQPFIVSGRCFGLYITFKCDTPYGYSGEYTETYSMDGLTTLDDIFYNTSDEQNEYLYPVIKIYPSSTASESDTLTIKNNSDNGNTMTVNLISGDHFTIDTENMLVYDENDKQIPLSSIGWDINEIFDYNNVSTGTYSLYWLRFLYGENKITLSSSKSTSVNKVEISVRFIRKAEGF